MNYTVKALGAGGHSWVSACSNSNNSIILAAATAVTYPGIFMSGNKCLTWSGINYSPYKAAAICYAHGAVCTTDGYIYTMGDSGGPYDPYDGSYVKRFSTGTQFSDIASNAIEFSTSFVAVDRSGKIYLSLDSGINWDMIYDTVNVTLYGCSMDYIGNTIFVVGGTALLWSTDGGLNWTRKNNLSIYNGWKCKCFGNLMMTVDINHPTNVLLTVSTDYGVTWSQKLIDDTIGTGGLACVNCTEDGKNIIVSIGNSYTYISNDYGNSWVKLLTSQSGGIPSLISNGSGIYAVPYALKESFILSVTNIYKIRPDISPTTLLEFR